MKVAKDALCHCAAFIRVKYLSTNVNSPSGLLLAKCFQKG